MKILLIGSGGREHTFAWKIRQSPLCSDLFIAPGNAGTKQYGKNIDIAANDINGIHQFIIDNHIDMLVVGPEEALVNGIYDQLKSDKNLPKLRIIGPSKLGATLEGSKEFAKEFMDKNHIPTAAYMSFSIDQLEAAYKFIDNQTVPIVLKADGLAAGKGVLIINDKEEAKTSIKTMLEGQFGNASSKVVVESFLDGIEFSVFVATDGSDYKILPIAKDYKRIGEGDTGLNTGGMGAVSPVPFVDKEMMKKVEERIIIPTINGIKKDNIQYSGFVFIGVINVKGEPFVIEYNCRMGDPETEVVLPRLENDIVELFLAMADGSINTIDIKIDSRFCTTVMLVSGGYPELYEKNKEVLELNDSDDCFIFHAGTKEEDGTIYTNGGRVLAISAFGKSMTAALDLSYKKAAEIQFEGKYYRKDIGKDLKNYLKKTV